MRIPGAATVRRAAWLAAASAIVPNAKRAPLLRRLGLRGMDEPFLCAGISLAGQGQNLTSGPGCFVNGEVYIEGGPVRLGTNVYIGPRAMILTSTHEMGAHDRRAGEPMHRAVEIGDGTWSGAGAIVLPGVSIGAGCVIGAGAVVTRDCAPDGVYVGVPAHRVRDLPDDEG